MLVHVSTQLVVTQCRYVCVCAMLINGTERSVPTAAAAAATLATRCKQRAECKPAIDQLRAAAALAHRPHDDDDDDDAIARRAHIITVSCALMATLCAAEAAG